MYSKKKVKIVALFLTLVLLLSLAVSSVSAETIQWRGNGTTNGACNTVSVDSTVTQGQQRWLFILTSPLPNGSYQLTTSFTPATQSPSNPIIGEKKANGAVHFTVYTNEGATLVSAFATGGTTGRGASVLTVSHCEVNPPPLRVSKTAYTSLTRTYNWNIYKSVTPASFDLFVGESGTSQYTVAITKTGYTDSNWAVNGSISIYNPSAFAATITGVTDSISGIGAIAVSCPVSFPSSLASHATLTCTYSTSLPNGDNRTNTATATTSGLVGGGSGSAAVDFASAQITSVNASIDVNDSYAGNLGSFSASGSTGYSRTFTCGETQDYPNTATISQTGQSSSANVHVNCKPRPAPKYWCSPGFWSQHPELALPEVNVNTVHYNTIGGAPLKAGSPSDPTLADVLNDPNIYGGEAFNSVANYIGAQKGWTGTQSTGENCPLDAHGNWIGQ
jgi:hypothetical protein